MKNSYTIKQRKALKKRAWKVFAFWVRNRDEACVTCGSKDNPQGGHFCHKREDFNEKNIHRQCMTCNWRKKGNMRYYTIYMIEKYGLKFVKNLMLCEKQPAKLESGEFYLNIISTYSKRNGLNDLQTQ